MSYIMATSLVDMKVGFSTEPDPIQGIPTLELLIQLLFHLCHYAQMHRSLVSDTMNLLFCACPRAIYHFFTANAYPDRCFNNINKVGNIILHVMAMELSPYKYLQGDL